jgi:hypothetical protein
VAATLQSGGISIFRLAEGRIAEHWEQLDRLGTKAAELRPANEAGYRSSVHRQAVAMAAVMGEGLKPLR